MRIFLAGSGGMLGHAAYEVLAPDHTLFCCDKVVDADWLEYCDFRDNRAYVDSAEDFRPDILFHLGAHTDLEYCEANQDDAYLTNTLAVEHAVGIARRLDIPLVYISTAGIFDGRKDLYDDWDVPCPLGVYARSKYLGELAVTQGLIRHFVFRPGWMMGGGPGKDKKFIGALMKQIDAGASCLHVVDDRFGTPTYTYDLIRTIMAVVQTNFYGVYNCAGLGSSSRLDVARHLLHSIGLSERVEIAPVSSDYFADRYSAPRPRSENLRNLKLELRGLNLMRDWRVALREYATRYVGCAAPGRVRPQGLPQ